MNHFSRTSTTLATAVLGVLTVAPGTAMAAGPQPLPTSACNQGTATASGKVTTVAAAESMPHIEHAAWLPVLTWCHHFNPTAPTPAGL